MGKTNSRSMHLHICFLVYLVAYKCTKVTAANASLPERCPEEFDSISLFATEYFPYLTVESKAFKGELKDYFDKSLSICCSKMKLDYNRIKVAVSDDIETTVRSYKGSQPRLFFPVFAKRNEHKQFDRRFLELYESSGFVVLQINKESSSTVLDNALKQLSALMKTWPIVVICVLAAILAGLVVWMLDCSKNDDFSPRFLDGAGSGIWWSFVTMTTVGYGDKSPKSALARFFAILWMLIGTILLSTFTAQITASIASFDVAEEFSVQNKKVAVPLGIQNYLDKELNLGGKYYEFPSNAIIEATFHGKTLALNNTQYVMLNDFETLRTWLYDHNKTCNATVKQVISHRMSLGVVISDVSSNRSIDFFDCWKRIVADQIAIDKLKKRAKYRERLRLVDDNTPTENRSVELKVIKGLACASGCLLLLGLIWEIYRRVKHPGLSSAASNPI